MLSAYRFAFRRTSGKLTYRYVWADNRLTATFTAIEYALAKNILYCGYRPAK